MPHSTYPDAADLSAFLASLGVTVTAALTAQLPAAAAASVSAWETATKRRPFVASATGTPVLRRFDPPTFHSDGVSTLYLPDLLAQEDITVGYQPSGSTLTTWTEGTDYCFGPVNAAADGLPYEWLEIYRHRWTQPLGASLRNSLRITGRWGYAAEVPDDVWYALLGRGFYHVFAAVRQGATGGVLSIEDADRKISFGIENWTQLLLPYVGPLTGTNAGNGGIWGDAVRLYQKVSL